MKFEPKWIAWEVTRECNLTCVHCRSNACLGAYKHLDFSTEQGFRVIDSIADYAKPVLVLSGGEPLLRRDVFELARYGHQKGLRMALASNGTYITEEICQRIIDANIKIVSLSIDGADAETHDQFRQQSGAFDSTVEAARLLKEFHIPFIINSSFTKDNVHHIPEAYRLAKKLGAMAWYMFMVVPTGRGENIINDLLDTEAYNGMLEWHYDMESAEDEMLVRPTCAPHYYRIRFEKNKAIGAKVKSRSLSFSTGGGKGCIAGQSIMTIDVEGNVQPCSYLPLKAGNLFQQSLKEIWEESELFNNLRDYKAYEGKCGKCEFIKVCGGCRARAYYMNGHYMAEEPLCEHKSTLYV